ncbi:MBL fold metallo-hydrolase [Microterricola viridarii]|uniref:Glyoxylase, beta-lactamase superfamily II n=1 Tax=Microterricola viridarii TaxID=412690 RepID=A0A1H1UM35_9MICO|nr:MBL fold metallo-hydrolase [Microterricola viridarii]SDS73523.1 Glyoxylase, beta-lactamase superfamily II [Microterricola viridarii]
MAEWAEVADGVWQARYQPLDVSICLVRGDDGLLLVDTRCGPGEAAEIVADAATLGQGGIRWVVNTHAHYDHTFGNQLFAPTATIYGHHRIAVHFRDYEAAELAGRPDVVLTPPQVSVDGPLELDLGGRTVRLVTLPPGHTDTDLVVHVPDAGCWIVGDVIEESGPPQAGPDAFPQDWPHALRTLADMVGPDERVVPGHGRVVDRAFVLAQAAELERPPTP